MGTSKDWTLRFKLPSTQFGLCNITPKLLKNKTEQNASLGEVLGENVTQGLKAAIIHRWECLGKCAF